MKVAHIMLGDMIFDEMVQHDVYENTYIHLCTMGVRRVCPMKEIPLPKQPEEKSGFVEPKEIPTKKQLKSLGRKKK